MVITLVLTKEIKVADGVLLHVVQMRCTIQNDEVFKQI